MLLSQNEAGAVTNASLLAGVIPAAKVGTASSISSETCVALNLKRGELVILGTQYAGEMKKGVFTMMNYLMPKQV